MTMFGFMEREKARHHIATMARVLGVSRSGFHASRVRPRSLRSFANEILGDLVTKIHAESRGTYGAPRVQAELRLAYDVRCGRKRVARIMRHLGLQGVSRRRLHRTTVRDETAAPAPDLVGRDFRADRPNQLWVADITYVATAQGFLISRQSSMPAPVAASAGRCATPCTPRSSPRRSTWRSRAHARRPA